MWSVIPYSEGISALKQKLDAPVKLPEFVLNNNLFEFKHKVKQQISRTAIETKLAPPYACIYIDKTETGFLKTQDLQTFIWLRYIDDIFFIWTHGGAGLKKFMEKLYQFLPNLKFRRHTLDMKSRFLEKVC